MGEAGHARSARDPCGGPSCLGYRRILTEFPGAAVAESTVRNHVRARKHALGLVRRETFVPQSYALGHEAQVD